jgi:uncharacterized protein YecT (DUF1311 family)
MRRAVHLASLCFVLTVLASHVQAEVSKPLRAADDRNINELVDSIYNKCGEEWGFPGAIANCVLEKEKEYGELLAQTYERAIIAAGKNASLLRESQKNWLTYQQTNCNFHQQRYSVEGQGISYAISATCMLRTTLQRLEELRQLAKQ